MSWSDPDVEAVDDTVFRIPLPLPGDGLKAVNVYALVGGDEIVLVDGGWALPGNLDLLAAALRGIGGDLRQVSRVLVTHAHRDHYSQAVLVRARTGARVGIGVGERENIRAAAAAQRQGVRGHSLDVLLRAGATTLHRSAQHDVGAPVVVWEDPDDWLTPGEVLDVAGRCLDPIATPGHTAGHLVFRDAAHGRLFAGDHVLPHITPSIGFEASPVRWPLRDYLTSLRTMLEVPDMRLLPAHGPVADSVHTRVHELIAHHDTRLARTEDAVRAGAATGLEVAGRLGWTRRERAFDTLDEHNQQLAVSETMAHLEVLVLQERLRSTTGEDGVVLYETVG